MPFVYRTNRSINNVGHPRTETIVINTTGSPTNFDTISPANANRELILRLSSTNETRPSALISPINGDNRGGAEAPHRHVTFTAETVDNEHMGRLKSNCCCIYVAPRAWNDPATWIQEENETEHCRGHTLPVAQESAATNGESEVNAESGNDEDLIVGEPLFELDEFVLNSFGKEKQKA